ncbi:hypothetical protein TNCV_108031 [Trichonephila clavipes]|nr:hypothetical protein TNCV_108031 [Trichonephila clavipes]
MMLHKELEFVSKKDNVTPFLRSIPSLIPQLEFQPINDAGSKADDCNNQSVDFLIIYASANHHSVSADTCPENDPNYRPRVCNARATALSYVMAITCVFTQLIKSSLVTYSRWATFQI